jgi:transposase
MPPVNRNNPINAKSSDSRYTLMDFMREFPDDATCLEWLWRTRFSPDGEHAHCPKCDAERVFKRYETSQSRQSWTCNGCGHHLHPTAGTIYHKSSTSLHLWFYAMFLMTSTRCGISAKQMERELGVNYKTAHRMMKLIRQDLMRQDETGFGGTVEADETYVGGKRRGRGAKRGRPGPGSHKVPVFGMVERGGRVMAMAVPDAKAITILPQLYTRTLPASTVYTDEFASYNPLQSLGFKHRRINHSEKVYVSGDVHTNTIEGFWALTKNGLRGVYHSVSTRHLQGYLNEYAWRYNHRSDERSQFETLLLRAASPQG